MNVYKQKFSMYLNKIKDLSNKESKKHLLKSFKVLMFGNSIKQGIIYKISLYALVIAFGFIFMYPIMHMVSMSLKNLSDLFNSQIIWIPSQLYLENYRVSAKVLNLPNSLLTILSLVILPALLATASSCITGYSLSRFNFPFKKTIMFIMIFIFVIPPQLLLLPQFVWFKELGLLGSVWTYILPALFGQGIFSTIYILIFYSFFNMVPKELDEAAYIDGANELQTFCHVGIKLSLQPFIICFAFSFVWYYNDYYRASFFLTQSKRKTIIQLLQIFESQFTQVEEIGEIALKLNEPIIMAATVLSILPLLFIYFCLQRYFVESVDRTGLTGE